MKQPMQGSFRTIDHRNEQRRTFADKLVSCSSANGVARLDFYESRILPPSSGKAPKTVDSLVASIAIPIHGLAEMHQTIGNLLAAMSADQQGPASPPH